jgi:hypothetical protein
MKFDFEWQVNDLLEPFTTGRLPAGKFICSSLPFVDFGDVPKAEITTLSPYDSITALGSADDAEGMSFGRKMSVTHQSLRQRRKLVKRGKYGLLLSQSVVPRPQPQFIPCTSY